MLLGPLALMCAVAMSIRREFFNVVMVRRFENYKNCIISSLVLTITELSSGEAFDHKLGFGRELVNWHADLSWRATGWEPRGNHPDKERVQKNGDHRCCRIAL
jgi:hypothetical protein